MNPRYALRRAAEEDLVKRHQKLTPWRHLIWNQKGAAIMPTLTIKSLPDDLYQKLKLSAHSHHRSINSELIYCLETVLKPRRISPAERVARARGVRPRIEKGGIDLDEILRAAEEGRP